MIETQTSNEKIDHNCDYRGKAMKLFYAPGTCATAVHITLELINEPYELEKVALGSVEYKKINPTGAVPAIIDGNIGPMFQADAILKYLTRKYPHANLGSDGSIIGEYELDHWLAFITGDLHPSFWPVFSPQKFTFDHSSKALQKVRSLSKMNLDRFYSYLNNHLENKNYIVAKKLTIADLYAYAMLRWTGYTPLKLIDYPNLYTFCSRIEEIEATKKALEIEGIEKIL